MDVSQYLEIFIDESEEHLQTLSDCIMVLEKEPDNKDTINEVFRAAHSLKGMAGTMGFKRMQHLTHDMENVFQEVRSDHIKVTSGMIDLLFKCLDALEGYVDNIKSTSDEGTEDNEVIIKELNDFIAKTEGAEEIGNTETSEAKEAAPESTQEEKAGQEKIELTNDEKKAIREAESNGQHIYVMTVHIQKDCLLKAARAFLVFKAVEDFGQILVYRPSSQDIEDEKFEFEFSFFLASEESEDKIVAAAKAVSEIEKVDAEEIHLDEYVKEAEAQEEQQAKEAAAEQKEAPAEAPKAAEKKAPAANAKKQTNAKPVTGRTVRVDIEKLDALMNQVSELIIAKNSLVSISSNESGEYQNQSFHEQIEYLERITTNLHESVMKVRMVPIESVVNKFPRMIRDLSRKLGKKMELYMTGEDTELDRTVVDQIGDPLQHLLRNSADHGLEDNATRVERGKPEVGSIFLKAFQEGNNVIIEVGDDGNGIDVAAVRDKAVERGVITAEQAENMSQKEIINLLFLPSFSMAKKITDISGRGVGLDVVKFFPAEAAGGLNMIKSMAAPYVNMKFMPTGGINAKNLTNYLDFNKIIACGGSWMVSKDLVAAKDWAGITALTKEAVSTMLGFKLLHVGVNNASEEAAASDSAKFATLLGQDVKVGNSSMFVGSLIEMMKNPGRGTCGHIAIQTNYLARAMYHLEKRGFVFDESSFKYDAKGNITVAYLKDEIAGFAVHFNQK